RGDLLPGLALVRAAPDLAVGRTEVDAGRVEPVRRHALAVHLEARALGQSLRHSLPGLAAVLAAVHGGTGFGGHAVVARQRDDIGGLGVVRVDRRGEAV